MTEYTTLYDVAANRGNSEDIDYHSYLGRVQDRFIQRTKHGTRPVFTTDAEDLWSNYLGAFPDHERQFHNCNACRRFIETYGGLVTLDEEGIQQSAIFAMDDTADLYAEAVGTILHRVRRARVTGVFLSTAPVWGQPKTGVWRHVAVAPPVPWRGNGLLTAHQAMAEKREDHHTVARALATFTLANVEDAVRLLKSETLYRSEKVLGAAEWLSKLHDARASALPGRNRDNVLWLAVATAPAGFCHPRASMIGTLLEDLAAGLGFEEVSRRFAAKMHPLQYQRPTAAPAAGNIAQAEAIVASLGIANSLKRRYARLEDIEAVWRPSAPDTPAASAGVFGHLLREKVTQGLQTPPVTLTWVKFAAVVLPTAQAIELSVPTHGNFTAFVTAEDMDAPPILQWDTAEKRNPVSWYVYSQGSAAYRWNLGGLTLVKVTAIALQPSMWSGDQRHAHHGKSVTFMLQGARDRENLSLSLFPELLKSELHAIRSTIEAYSLRGRLSGEADASACGLRLQADHKFGTLAEVHLRVTSGGHAALYKIDRWD